LGIAGEAFLQARCPSCHPPNSVKALNGQSKYVLLNRKLLHDEIIH